MHFLNRYDAAMQLIPFLNKYRNEHGIVLAVPRGGVPIGYYIAKNYNLPLELLMVKKIGHPANEEFAVGAVSMEDYVVDETTDVSKEYIEQEVKKIWQSLNDRYKKFMGDHEPVDVHNKVVIIVDDGIATGNTMLASIKMLKAKKPKKIVVAVPVAPPETAEKIRALVDDFICIYTPPNFIGVGYHYHDFSEVSDDEVIQLLKDANHLEDVA